MRRWAVAVVFVACSKQAEETPKAESVRVQMPKARAGGEIAAVAQVHLEAGGGVVLNGAPVKLDELSEKLRAMRAVTPAVEVHLDAASDVPYAKVIEALDAAHKAGIVDISFDSAPEKPVEAPSKQH